MAENARVFRTEDMKKNTRPSKGARLAALAGAIVGELTSNLQGMEMRICQKLGTRIGDSHALLRDVMQDLPARTHDMLINTIRADNAQAAREIYGQLQAGTRQMQGGLRPVGLEQITQFAPRVEEMVGMRLGLQPGDVPMLNEYEAIMPDGMIARLGIDGTTGNVQRGVISGNIIQRRRDGLEPAEVESINRTVLPGGDLAWVLQGSGQARVLTFEVETPSGTWGFTAEGKLYQRQPELPVGVTVRASLWCDRCHMAHANVYHAQGDVVKLVTTDSPHYSTDV